ncbi:hypothetical protein L0337_30235 [candidate division KSB1 bacterium]|nr:hypothetical protein [candidate division KSB1 bacterium]
MQSQSRRRLRLLSHWSLREMMDGRKISMLLTGAVSIVMLGFGIMVLAGWVFPQAPNSVRVMVGIVFLLMGVHRFLMTRLQAKQAERLDE